MKKTIKIIFIILFLMNVSIFGCVHVPLEITEGEIEDIRRLPQDNTFYLNPEASDKEIMPPDFQKNLNSHYRKQFFLPWHKEKPSFSLEQVLYGFKRYTEEPGFGENMRRHSEGWIEGLKQLANLETYPNCGKRAITIGAANQRVLPTHKPLFQDFHKAGLGFPFDMLQNSALWANTPLYVSHVSHDGSWVLAESPFALGWVPVADIAFVDEDFMKLWEGSGFIALIKDRVPIHDDNAVFRFYAHIGSLFPLCNEKNGDFTILIAISDVSRNVLIKEGLIAKECAVAQPLKATQRNIAHIANELLNQPYGWGGLYENRDCSAMIRDLFAPFGLWLPRNSADQAHSGMFISLKNLPPQEKEKVILENGIPFATLIWMRGHSMLYIGSFENKRVIFHNLWGIKTGNFITGEGRKIVGHAAITTLHPGIELSNIQLPEGDLLYRVEGMTILISPEALQN